MGWDSDEDCQAIGIPPYSDVLTNDLRIDVLQDI